MTTLQESGRSTVQLTSEQFISRMEGFGERHADTLLSFYRDIQLPSDFKLWFTGTIASGLQANVEFFPARQEFPDGILQMGVTISTLNWQLETSDINTLNHRMHRNFPETREFSIFSDATEKDIDVVLAKSIRCIKFARVE